jgi:malate dehydrogenase
MVYELKKVTGFPRERVVGMAGVLDAGRFQLFLAREAGRGGEGRARHGARRPRRHDGAGHQRTAPIFGVPVTQLIAADKLQAIVERTRNGGGEIVKLMGTSAYYAPASAAVLDGRGVLKDGSACCRRRPTSTASTATRISTWASPS